MPLGQMAGMGVEIRALAEMRLVKLRVDVLGLHNDAQDDRRQRRRCEWLPLRGTTARYSVWHSYTHQGFRPE